MFHSLHSIHMKGRRILHQKEVKIKFCRLFEYSLPIKKRANLYKMVPVGRTLEKKSVQPTGIFIYFNFRIWRLGDNMSKITFSSKEINIGMSTLN
ncbi:hypothetical protein HW35_14580 [Bacillus sp. X1(2014)]|nr:hypothetical protein HW35_14580 [Bacillus sp. X1(2014)]